MSGHNSKHYERKVTVKGFSNNFRYFFIILFSSYLHVKTHEKRLDGHLSGVMINFRFDVNDVLS